MANDTYSYNRQAHRLSMAKKHLEQCVALLQEASMYEVNHSMSDGDEYRPLVEQAQALKENLDDMHLAVFALSDLG